MTHARPRTAILLLSHVLNKHVLALFDELRMDCYPAHDVTLLADNTKGVFNAYRDDDRFCLFTLKQLQTLGYPGKSAIVHTEALRKQNPFHRSFNFVPGSTDLPVLSWWRQHAVYDFVWIVEYDVRYSGAWPGFFDEFAENDADLLATTLTRYVDIPNWYHWPSLNLLEARPDTSTYVRGFFPVYRLSRRALETLDGEYRRGIGGHYEAVVATVLCRAGLRIEDIGGDGEFVRPENVNRYYRNTPKEGPLSPGTFVFRPIRPAPGKRPNTLWHPVKPRPSLPSVLGSVFRRLRR